MVKKIILIINMENGVRVKKVVENKLVMKIIKKKKRKNKKIKFKRMEVRMLERK
jgi:hypothetical protein